MMDQLSLDDMINFCTPVVSKANSDNGARQQPPPKLPTKRSIRRPLPNQLRHAIITIAFNSDSDFTEIRHRPAAIAKLFGLQRNTVRSVIQSFIKHGKDYNNICDRRHLKSNDFTVFEANDLGKQLLQPELLQRWASKTLLERVALVRREFNVHVSYYKLRLFYMKNGVKWRSTQMVYR